MLAFLLAMSLAAAPQAGVATAATPPHADAAALVRDGHFEAALAAFRRLASVNPRDHEARIWIARLHVLMDHPELAEPVYRSVLLEDEASFDAMLGLGRTLVVLGRVEEGIALLERAERLQPQDPQLLEALGRAYGTAGRPTRGLLYAERAAASAPGPSTRQTLEQARLLHGHRLEVQSFGERYNTAADDTGNVDLRLNVRVNDRLRVVGRGQHQQKFAFTEQRGGGGVEWQWRPQTRLSAQVLGGPRSNAVLPRLDVAGEATRTEGPADWVAGYRFVDFPSARVSVVSPGVTWWPTPRTSFGVRYFLSITDAARLADHQAGHGVMLRVSRQFAPRIRGLAGYTRGADDYDTLSPDQTGDFAAHALSGGLQFDLPTLTALVARYQHQWRPNDVRMHRVSLALVQRF
jgi:YaiO family outer membrane protein